MRAGAFILALALAAPAGAQPDRDDRPPLVTIVPAPAERAISRFPEAERVKAVDIPQWAKDAGHNGRATYRATIAPDNTLIGLELVESSGSPVIDAAVKARAATLWYRAAIDPAGEPFESTKRIVMEYARYDWKSPGGGIATYTCGDLVREWDWFASVDPAPALPFLPQTVFLELPIWVRVEQRQKLDPAAIDEEMAARRQSWPALVEMCRKTPDRLMLEQVDHPETFARRMAQY